MRITQIESPWWHPPEMRRFRVRPHAEFTHTIRNNRTDRCEYFFNSLITRSQHPCFSFNEYRFYSWLDLQPEVSSYRSQPLPIIYEMNGCEYSYTTDVFVDYFDESKSAVEVKEESEAHKNYEKWQCVKKAFAEQGRSFAVITDKDLKAQPLLHNVEMIRREIDSRPPVDTVYRLTNAFQHGGEIPFGKLLEYALESEEWARMHILHLVCMRRLTFDFQNLHLDQDTPIRLVWNSLSRSATDAFLRDVA